MRFGTLRLILLAMACVLPKGPALAQNPSGNSTGLPLTHLADSLRARGIATSEQALTAALRNNDPTVRSLAALKLAEDHKLQAVTLIEHALWSEKDSKAKIAMAESLWSLHDTNGLTYLQTMCNDRSLSIYTIIQIAQNLDVISQSNANCAVPMLDYLASHRGSESRLTIIPALPAIHRWASPEETGQIARELVSSLSDSDPAVRMAAGDGIARADLKSEEDALLTAISQETDPVVRTQMQRSLDLLLSRAGTNSNH